MEYYSTTNINEVSLLAKTLINFENIMLSEKVTKDHISRYNLYEMSRIGKYTQYICIHIYIYYIYIYNIYRIQIISCLPLEGRVEGLKSYF